MNNLFLLDNDFLYKLNNQPQRELWVKILALTIDEDPIEEIVGRVTGGSISVDGNSKLRRSCSLSLISDRLQVNEYIWGLNTKVKVSIGMRNKTNHSVDYGEVVWFPQGTYVLNSFNISISNQGSTISLQGKDKMCLLNGDLGGNLTALSYAFDIVEEENGYNSYYKKKLPLRYIIREAVHTFANEPYHNIIINDLDDWGLELLTYRGEEPMYFVYNPKADDIVNMTINPQQTYWIGESGSRTELTIEQLSQRDNFHFKVLNDFIAQSDQKPTSVYGENTGGDALELIKIEYGMTCGYRITDLIYPKELTLNVGEGLTSMLDKLVSMLGNFEYFYNLDGQFVFQKKQTYVHTSWNNLTDNEEEQWADHTAYTSSHVYSLYDSKLVSSFSNAPALNNVKNDFSIWGTRKGTTGVELPIHMRYAIDKKPVYYTTVDGTKTYTTKTEAEVEEDKKSGMSDLATQGYQKETSRFGLSEDWWEVRDWAKAWVFSGLSVPDQKLGNYCPIRSIVYDETTKPPSPGRDFELVPIPHDIWVQWKIPGSYIQTDDLIFYSDGTYRSAHGNCAHSYSQWLDYFEPGGTYEGGYAYFYKPQIPEDQLAANGGQGLLLGGQIIYEADWRELIYQMALDHNKYGNLDNSNPKTILVKAKRKDKNNKYEILTKEQYLRMENSYDKTTYREINLTTAIRERNSTFFPSGYTGYEQYYIDILGFWRQLYNPDYECSYDIEPMVRLEYDSIQEENKFFYDAPVYTNCTKDSIYYGDIDYYTLEDGEYVQALMLTKTEFDNNKTAYYYITDVKITPVPISVSKVEKNQTYYRTTDHVPITITDGVTIDPKLYSKRHEETKYVPLFSFDAFHRAYMYNKYDVVAGVYRPETKGITSGDYLARPWVYFRNKSGKQVCCTSISIPGPTGRSSDCWFADHDKKVMTTYSPMANCPYALNWSHGDSVTLDKNISNDVLKDICLNATRCDSTLTFQQAHMPWYYCYKVYTYEPLVKPAIPYDPQGTYYTKSDIVEFNPKGSKNQYWKYDLITHPESLIFWFDFLDTEGELDNYSVPRIGDRPKAVNDKDVKAIYFRETPGIIFLEPDEWSRYDDDKSLEKPTGYAYAQLPFYLQHLFAISSQGKSAKDVLDEYLYQYSYCTESVTVSALPIYHLEPNTRILIRDDKSRINGEYIINKMTIPLDPKGSMTINAVKAIDRLY